MFAKLHLFVVLICFFVVRPSVASADVILRGLNIFSTDGSGNDQRLTWWHTDGSRIGDDYNLYVTQPNSGVSGEFVNSGDGPTASISIPLSLGENTFYFFGDSAAVMPTYGLNLFFTDDVHPQISAFAPRHTSSNILDAPDFYANTSPVTLSLDAKSSVPGAGTLSWTSETHSVALTQFHWSSGYSDVDRVSPFDIVPNRNGDFVGFVSLNVSAIPEPCSSVLLLSLGCGAAFLRKRARRFSKSV